MWCVLATEEHIFSCGADKTIAVWSVADALRGVATLVGRLAHHNDVVYSLLLAFGKAMGLFGRAYSEPDSEPDAAQGERNEAAAVAISWPVRWLSENETFGIV